MRSVILVSIRAYQVAISPLLPGACRYSPTCSQYALEAVSRHGAARGSWLALRRLLRCHPFGGVGYDPVPPSNPRVPGEEPGVEPGRGR
ncbi:MAG: membrane protein insertion efficiency factor YidD [Gemmatimonadota bacterium]|nr:MAG: membrane protein insertion efficiency factor YidD [Gemmatimonadota bacterium]